MNIGTQPRKETCKRKHLGKLLEICQELGLDFLISFSRYMPPKYLLDIIHYEIVNIELEMHIISPYQCEAPVF